MNGVVVNCDNQMLFLESLVRTRLRAGAKGLRTPGPTVNGADTEGRPTPTIAPSPESAAYRSGVSLRQHVGPGVRIHFAPAASRLRTCLRQKEPGSHRTLRWRKRNSNLLSPVRKIYANTKTLLLNA